MPEKRSSECGVRVACYYFGVNLILERSNERICELRNALDAPRLPRILYKRS